jgi:hypothetical protein
MNDLFDDVPTCAFISCKHPQGFITRSVVPAGYFCTKCQTLIWQYWIPPNQPEIIGYISVDWKWYYQDKKPWITQPAPRAETEVI